MKKFKIVNIIIALVLMVTACDKTYDKIYDEIDKDNAAQDELDLKYSDKTTSPEVYTLTEDDYETIGDLALDAAVTENDSSNAEDIADYKNFSDDIPAKSYIPYLLNDLYFSYKAGTEMEVTYKFYRGQNTYISEFNADNFETYTLVTADYDWMGEGEDEPGEFDNFSSSVSPEDFLPAFLDSAYADASEYDYKKIIYNYYSGGVIVKYDVFYLEGGEWKKMNNVYELTSDDYDSMGEPGAYNNFSSSVSPNDYLPTFLSLNFPYGNEEGDMKVILYKYYSSGSTKYRAKEYVYDGSVWAEYNSTVDQAAIFKFTDEGWLFVPPLKFVETTLPATRFYTLVDADYELTGDGQFHNFTISWGGIAERVATILKARFNDIAVGDVFEVTYKGYSGTVSDYTIKLEVQLDE